MKILFVGNFSEPWSTNIPMVQELKKQNHKVKNFDFRTISLKNRKFKRNKLLKLVQKIIFDISKKYYMPNTFRNLKYFLFGNKTMNNLLLADVSKNKYDVIILAKTDTVNYKIIPRLKRYSKVFYYFMDPLAVAYSISAQNYAKLSTWSTASTRCMNLLFKKAGANSRYLLQGYNNNLFKPNEINGNKEIDVIFVGSISSDRKKYIDFLVKNRINVICFGPGWKNKPIYLTELVGKYQASKIILNFPKVDSGFSIRVFQAMGTGSFLLSKYSSDLEKIFKKEEHIDWFKTPQECLKLVRFYLENDKIREKIATRGYELVSKNYTWKIIMKILTDIVLGAC
jgi:spore maturation protein CgeB